MGTEVGRNVARPRNPNNRTATKAHRSKSHRKRRARLPRSLFRRTPLPPRLPSRLQKSLPRRGSSPPPCHPSTHPQTGSHTLREPAGTPPVSPPQIQTSRYLPPRPSPCQKTWWEKQIERPPMPRRSLKGRMYPSHTKPLSWRIPWCFSRGIDRRRSLWGPHQDSKEWSMAWATQNEMWEHTCVVHVDSTSKQLLVPRKNS